MYRPPPQLRPTWRCEMTRNKRKWQWLRRSILERDKRCLACGRPSNLMIDHIVPRSKGGRDELDNLQTLCEECNQRKADRTIDYRSGSEEHRAAQVERDFAELQ